MNTPLPSAHEWKLLRRHKLRQLHRWAGIIALVFLVMLSLTGLALNHANTLGLDRRTVSASWLLDWYGLETPALTGYVANDGWVVAVGDRVWSDAGLLPFTVDALTGAAGLADGTLVVADRAIVRIVSADGLVLDEIRSDEVRRIGTAEGSDTLVIDAGASPQAFSVRTLRQVPVPERVQWGEAVAPPAAVAAEVQAQWRGNSLTIERLLLDLHSGRIAGLSGTLVADLAALAMLFLAFSGFVLWRRRKA